MNRKPLIWDEFGLRRNSRSNKKHTPKSVRRATAKRQRIARRIQRQE